jgi:hypothetical protein
MNLYLTEREADGVKFAGLDIEAASWDEAEAKAQEAGLRLVGKLETRFMRA